MGIILPKRTPKIPTPDVESLSQDEINAIVETWKIPSVKLINSGEKILLKFFDIHPEHQRVFENFRHLPVLQLRGHPVFRSHASKIMNVFDSSVDCLERENGMEGIMVLWHGIGRSHHLRKITRKQFMDLCAIFMEILDEMCNLNELQKSAWIKLINTAYHFLFETLGDS